MSEVKVLNVDPDSGEYSCVTYTLEVDGKKYTEEHWATDSSSGVELYDENGAAVPYDKYPSALEDWDAEEDEKIAQYWARYHDEVMPLIARLKAEVFGS